MTDKQFAKLIVFTNALVPLAVLIYDKSTDRLGADPAHYILTTTGLLAIIFLVLSLMVTPLRRITGQNYYSLFRRMLGLYAFFYGSLHLLTYFFFYRSTFAIAIDEILHSNYIIYGIIAFLLMIPLALTSTAGSIKRLGNKRWKLLHKLVYVSAFLAALHYNFAGKQPSNQAIIFGLIIDALLLFRFFAYLKDRFFPKQKPKPEPRMAIQGQAKES